MKKKTMSSRGFFIFMNEFRLDDYCERLRSIYYYASWLRKYTKVEAFIYNAVQIEN